MSTISAQQVKELREKTGSGLMECKKALQESDGNIDEAISILRKKGQATAEKKAGRSTSEGAVSSYIHTGGRVGVLIEVNCETDFVANTDEFKALVHDIAMQIAAASPVAVTREEIPGEIVEKERAVFRTQALEEGKPDKVVDKIVDGRIEKFFSETALLDQTYVKDSDKKVDDLVKETIAVLGENIRVARFARFQLGQ